MRCWFPGRRGRWRSAEPEAVLGCFPVVRDRSLRAGEADSAAAYGLVQRVLDSVLGIGQRADLRPQVGRVVITAEFERNQVVELTLITGGNSVCRVGLAELKRLGLRFRRPDALGITGDADGGLDVRLGH